MKSCTNPEGHDWYPISFETRGGSTPVACDLCGEVGYRINDRVMEPNVSGTDEEGLF